MELEAAGAAAAAGSRSSSGKKQYKLNKKQFIKFLICIFLAIALLITAYATIVIIKAPKIETNNIYSLLSQSSILYDDSGQIIDKEGERALIKHYAGTDTLKADILKIGHHGSRTSTSPEFLSAVSPDAAVIQVGRNNYGHPSKSLLGLWISAASDSLPIQPASLKTLEKSRMMQ